MKSLTFDNQYIADILSGEKSATWRIGKKDYEVDDIISLVNSNDQKIFGYGLINEIIEKRIGELTEQDKKGHETYFSEEEMYKKLRKYYGSSVNKNSAIKIIKFKLLDKLPEEENSDLSYLLEINIYTDGGSRGNPGPSASGVVILDKDNNVVKKTGEYLGISTNNQAEYKALLLGIKEAIQLDAKRINIYMDSLLIINQMLGKYKIKNQELLPIYIEVTRLIKNFEKVTFTHIPRELNKLADQKVNDILDLHQ